MDDCWQPQASFVGSQWIPQGNHQQPCLHTAALRGPTYAFPRPRHTRVMKPRSAGNSPSFVGRRAATLPHYSMMQQPLPNQDYQSTLAAAFISSALRGRRSRPISWHLTSAGNFGYSKAPYISGSISENCTAMDLSVQPLDTVPTYGEGNLLSYPTSDIPTSNQYFLPDMPVQHASPLQMDGSHIDPLPWNATADGLPAIPQTISQDWPFDMTSMDNIVPPPLVPSSNYGSVPSSGDFTGPSTPDFLPIQQFDIDPESQTQPTLNTQKPEDELVGMGLYSDPEVPEEHSLLGVSGKGLKLEETFTPSSDNEAEEDNEETEEDASEQSNQEKSEVNYEQLQTTIPPEQPAKAPPSMLQKSFFFDDCHDDTSSIHHAITAGSQHLFNFGNQTCMNYGYGWI